MALLHKSRDDNSPTPPIEPSSARRERNITARIHTVGCSGLRTATVRSFRLSSGDGDDIAGFDLGPSPEEHLLVAIGSSLAQTIAHVACARDLSVDRIDIDLSARLISDGITAHPAGHIERIDGRATLASDDSVSAFDGIARAILDASPLAGIISVPLDLQLTIVEAESESNRYGDWQI